MKLYIFVLEQFVNKSMDFNLVCHMVLDCMCPLLAIYDESR